MTMFTVKNHTAMTSAARCAEASFPCANAGRFGASSANSIIAIVDAIFVASLFVVLVLGLAALLGLALAALLVVVSLITLLVLLAQVHQPKEQPQP